MPFDVYGALKEGYTPSQVADFLAKNPNDSPIDVAGARKEGYNDDQIVDFVNKPSALQTLHEGVDELTSPMLSGIANSLKTAGAKSTGDWIQNHLVDQDIAQHTGLSKVGDDWHKGNYGHVVGDVLQGAAQNAIPLALQGVGYGLAGPLGGGLVGSALYGGDTAMERAKNNGREGNPTWGDAAAGFGGQFLLNALPFGGPMAGLVDRAGVGLLSKGGQLALRDTAGGIAGQVAKHAGADALQAAGSQALGSTGTEAGTQIDPAQIIGAAAMGGVTRAGLGAAGKLAGRPASDQAEQAALAQARAQTSQMPPDQQADAMSNARNTVAAKEAMQAVQQNAVGKEAKDVSGSIAARKAADNQVSDLKGLVKKLDDAGALADGDADTMKQLTQIARNSQRPLEKSDLEKIDDLGVPEPTKVLFRDMLTQINMLSDAGIMKRGESSLATAGGLVGKVIAMPLPHIIGRYAEPAGSYLGSKIADRLGMTNPKLVNQSMNAMRLLNANDIPLPNTPVELARATDAANDMLASQRALFAQKPTSDDIALANYMNRDLDIQNKIKTKAQAEADAKDVEKQAEARLAAQQFTNQVKLAAEGRSPPPNPQVGDTATAAAIARAQIDAQGVRNLANQGADARDRLAMGLPATDPTPVNTPIDAQGRPIIQNPAIQQAQHRAILQKIIANNLPHPEDEATATPNANPSPLEAALREPAPVPEGFSHEAALKGQLLPEWMYGLGRNLQEELNLSGKPRSVDHAKEVLQAIRELRDQGAFGDPSGAGHEFAVNMLNHNGRVVRGVYNLVRNQMLLNNGIDRQSPAARGLILEAPSQ